jgi:hypothetical protein
MKWPVNCLRPPVKLADTPVCDALDQTAAISCCYQHVEEGVVCQTRVILTIRMEPSIDRVALYS